MPPIQGYEASVEAAKRALEAAQSALPRDIAQAVANADWVAFLRDRHDVQALVDHIAEAVQQREFVSKLHAAADKAGTSSPSGAGRRSRIRRWRRKPPVMLMWAQMAAPLRSNVSTALENAVGPGGHC